MNIFLYRAYNDVNWATKLPPNLSYPSLSTLHNLPDPVSIRFTNKRNELHPKQWQVLSIYLVTMVTEYCRH